MLRLDRLNHPHPAAVRKDGKGPKTLLNDLASVFVRCIEIFKAWRNRVYLSLGRLEWGIAWPMVMTAACTFTQPEAAALLTGGKLAKH